MMSLSGKAVAVFGWLLVAVVAVSSARYTDNLKLAALAKIGGLKSGGSEEVDQRYLGREPYALDWSEAVALDGPRDFYQGSAEVEAPEELSAPTAFKRQIRLDNMKRSRLNRLVQQLLMIRGDRYHYDRVAPLRFGGGRR